MKKRFLGLVLALSCLLMPILTACSDGADYVATSKVKPMTITLYGITGESTTEEAILAVQNELNQYTEGNLNTRVLLRLFTEDEYYEKLDEAIEKAQAYKANNGEAEPAATENEAETTDDDGKGDRFEVKFENEKGTQVDIFMVRGAEQLRKYAESKIAASLKIEEKSSIIGQYISKRYLALASDGKPTSGGNVNTKATLYGIPCNYVVGDYTYLLVNKEIASRYGYAAQDVDTLDELAFFLNDAATDYRDYITLYNTPELNIETIGNTLIGTTIANNTHAFSYLQPGSLLSDNNFVNYKKNIKLYELNGYVTEGDYYSLPEDKKVAAAFVKGNAALPAEYEDDYIVVPYSKPCVEDIGTVFCVSTLSASTARCLEVISAIMTNTEYRNTLQYGVENKHYKVNDYTHELEIISDEYSMNYADTGNMFILKPNASMSKEMLALAANNWALAKQQYRDASVNPYTTPFVQFALKYYDDSNSASSVWYSDLYAYNMAQLVAEFDDYKAGLEAAIAEEQAKVDAENEANKDKDGWVNKEVDVQKITESFTTNYVKQFEATEDGEWYKTVLNGKVEANITSLLKEKKTIAESYYAAKAQAESKGQTFDEAAWYKTILGGRTVFSMAPIYDDSLAYKAALKAARTQAEKDGVEFVQADFDAAYEVEVNVDAIIEEGKAFIDAIAAAKAQTPEGKKFDEDAFTAEYIKADVDEIKGRYTFAYAPGSTSDNIAAIEALTETYLNKLMNYNPSSGKTFEEHAAIVASQYMEEAVVALMLDTTYGDSIVAQYIAWAAGAGVVAGK